MANQPAHEWNANIFYQVEKAAKDIITLACKVLKNSKSANPQILSLDDPLADVIALSGLARTLFDVLEDRGVTPEMVARLMGKIAGGRDHAIHRLLPQVKKEIKLEMKECKSLTIPRLDQKKADVAASKRHPKAKGKGKGPKSSRETATDVDCVGGEVPEDEAREDAEHGKFAEGVLDVTESKKRRTVEHTNTLLVDSKPNEGLIEPEGSDEGNLESKGKTPVSLQGNAADFGIEEIVVLKDFEKVKCTEQVSDTSDGKKRRRTKSTKNALEADDEDKENEGIVAGEASDEHAVA